MAFCTKCGANVPTGIRFCMDCGNPVDEAPQPASEMNEHQNQGFTQQASPGYAQSPPQSSYAQAQTPPPQSSYAQAQTPPPQSSYAQAQTPPPQSSYAQAQTPPPQSSNAQAQTPPTHPSYAPPAPVNPDVNYDAPPPRGGRYSLMSTGSYVGHMILFSIPLIGWIACIIIAATAKNQNKGNFAKALIVLFLLSLVMYMLLFLIISIFFTAFWDVLTGYIRITYDSF